MTKLTITIDCENSAFDDSWLYPEVARILRALANGMGDEEISNIYDKPECSLRDRNGNLVGKAIWDNE